MSSRVLLILPIKKKTRPPIKWQNISNVKTFFEMISRFVFIFPKLEINRRKGWTPPAFNLFHYYSQPVFIKLLIDNGKKFRWFRLVVLFLVTQCRPFWPGGMVVHPTLILTWLLMLFLPGSMAIDYRNMYIGMIPINETAYEWDESCYVFNNHTYSTNKHFLLFWLNFTKLHPPKKNHTCRGLLRQSRLFV